MSLKAKIEAVIYAAEEPVTLPQLLALFGEQAQAELAADSLQRELALETGPADEEHRMPSDTGPAAETAAADAARNAAKSETKDAALNGSTPAALRARERRVRDHLRSVLDTLLAEYREQDRGLEIREIAGGFRFATKPEYHDAVRGFVRSLKPPLKLSLQALETLAVIAYKQPVTAPEISEIRGVDSNGVLGSLITRKLITAAGRKQVIGRPMLYKTAKEFLLRFGLKDLNELPSIEDFERMASDLNEAGGEHLSDEVSTFQEDRKEGRMPELGNTQESITGRETPVVPVAVAADAEPLSTAEVAREVQPSREAHAAQADGDPNAPVLAQKADREGTPPFAETDADQEHLTPAADGPGEFTGNETVPPVDNTEVDGRISGLPPTYNDRQDEATDSPANDAASQLEQSAQPEQMGNAGSDD